MDRTPDMFLLCHCIKTTGKTDYFVLKKEEVLCFAQYYLSIWDFPGGSVVKNLSANAGDEGDLGSILGLGRSLEEEMSTHSGILAWRIPRTEEPGRLQSIGWQRVRYN